jgi:hypothetical protein
VWIYGNKEHNHQPYIKVVEPNCKISLNLKTGGQVTYSEGSLGVRASLIGNLRYSYGGNIGDWDLSGWCGALNGATWIPKAEVDIPEQSVAIEATRVNEKLEYNTHKNKGSGKVLGFLSTFGTVGYLWGSAETNHEWTSWGTTQELVSYVGNPYFKHDKNNDHQMKKKANVPFTTEKTREPGKSYDFYDFIVFIQTTGTISVLRNEETDVAKITSFRFRSFVETLDLP